MLVGHGGETPLDPEITMASIQQPGRTIWLGESGENLDWCNCGAGPPGSCWNNPCVDLSAASENSNNNFQVTSRGNNLKEPVNENTSFGDYHNGGNNFAFEDGHVKWYLTQDTINLNGAVEGPVAADQALGAV